MSKKNIPNKKLMKQKGIKRRVNMMGAVVAINKYQEERTSSINSSKSILDMILDKKHRENMFDKIVENYEETEEEKAIFEAMTERRKRKWVVLMACPLLPVNPKRSSQHEKGSIYWYDITGNSDSSIASQKARPFMIISRDNPKSNRVIVCPISGVEGYLERDANKHFIVPQKLKYPFHARINKLDYPFLEKDSAVLLDQVYTVAKSELYEEWFMGKITNLREIDSALYYNYDLFETISDTLVDFIATIKTSHISNYTRK